MLKVTSTATACCVLLICPCRSTCTGRAHRPLALWRYGEVAVGVVGPRRRKCYLSRNGASAFAPCHFETADLRFIA